MTGINYLIARGPQYDIPGAFQQGVQQGQQANMLAAASQAAQRGDYAALGNALLQLGDVSGALTALKTPEEQRRTRALEERQRQIDELNRRNIESEMKAREAAVGARDLRAVGNKVVDFSDPNNPRVVYSTPTAADALAAQLDSGGAPPPAAAPAGPAPAPTPAAPAGYVGGPRVQPPVVASMISGKGDLLTGQGGVAMGGAPVVPAAATPTPQAPPPPASAAAPTPPRTGTLADLTPQQRATARTLLVTDPTGATANKFVTDILTGASAAAATKGQQPKPQPGHRFTYDEQGNIIGQERLPGVAPSEQETRAEAAKTFIAEAPDIKQAITQIFGGEGGDPLRFNARTNMALGRGIEGEAYRRNQLGVDAFTRAMTGAGLNMTEIANYGGRYQIDPLRDTAQMMLDKIDGLSRDLNAITGIVNKGGDSEQTKTALRRYLDANAPKPAGAPAPQGTQTVGPRGQAAPRLTQEQYNAAKPGTLFIAVDDPSGTVRIKQ